MMEIERFEIKRSQKIERLGNGKIRKSEDSKFEKKNEISNRLKIGSWENNEIKRIRQSIKLKDGDSNCQKLLRKICRYCYICTLMRCRLDYNV